MRLCLAACQAAGGGGWPRAASPVRLARARLPSRLKLAVSRRLTCSCDSTPACGRRLEGYQRRSRPCIATPVYSNADGVEGSAVGGEACRELSKAPPPGEPQYHAKAADRLRPMLAPRFAGPDGLRRQALAPQPPEVVAKLLLGSILPGWTKTGSERGFVIRVCCTRRCARMCIRPRVSALVGACVALPPLGKGAAF